MNKQELMDVAVDFVESKGWKVLATYPKLSISIVALDNEGRVRMIEVRTNSQRNAARSRIEADSLSIMSEHGAALLDKKMDYDRIVFNPNTAPQMLRYQKRTLSEERKDDNLSTAGAGNHAEPGSKQMQMRALVAAERFLARHDYEILDKFFVTARGVIDIVALDPKYGEDIVFVDVLVREGKMPRECLTEGAMERARAMAAEWLKMHPEMTGSPRFDIVSLAVVDGDRAYLRHHIAAFDGLADAQSKAL